MTALGRVAGLVGTDLLLVQLMLIGRTPVLDRLFGMDQLVRWHRWVGHTSFYLIVAHIVFITMGYAGLARLTLTREAYSLVLIERDVLMATVSFGLLFAIVITSIRIARKAMRYETWLFVHVYAYVAIALAVPHEIFDGNDFEGHMATQIYWGVLYALSIGAILWFRVATPIRLLFRHQLQVAKVVPENDDTVSIYMTGRNLSRLQAQSGQFFMWRFLIRGHWWQAHPYSLSAAPNSKFLRITVKDLGDASGDIIDVPRGASVIAEGPYGGFTAERRTHRRILLVAGGIGVTPVRALFESIPARDGDITFIYRASKPDDVLFLRELRNIAAERNAKLHFVVGTRRDFPRRRQPLSPGHLQYLVPKLEEHDIYMCGPDGMTNRVLRALRYLGIDEHQIHHEAFGY